MAHKHHDIPEDAQALVITVSDTRTDTDDGSGDHIVRSLLGKGIKTVTKTIIPDSMEKIGFTVQQNLEAVDLMVITGGTGISRRDVTVEAVEFDKVLPGFGELFRSLSYREVGSRAMMSRATLGIKAGIPIFCLPGSLNAVTLAMEKLVLPEIGHILWELNR